MYLIILLMYTTSFSLGRVKLKKHHLSTLQVSELFSSVLRNMNVFNLQGFSLIFYSLWFLPHMSPYSTSKFSTFIQSSSEICKQHLDFINSCILSPIIYFVSNNLCGPYDTMRNGGSMTKSTQIVLEWQIGHLISEGIFQFEHLILH